MCNAPPSRPSSSSGPALRRQPSRSHPARQSVSVNRRGRFECETTGKDVSAGRVVSDRLVLDPDRLFSPEARQRRSPGSCTTRSSTSRCSARTATPTPGGSPTTSRSTTRRSLLVTPDHYLTRMLYSQGVPLEALGVTAARRSEDRSTAALAWRTFADALPPVPWHAVRVVDEPRPERGVRRRRPTHRADRRRDLRPDRRLPRRRRVPAQRALLDRFRIEVVATTDSPLDDLPTTAPARGRRSRRPGHPDVPTRRRRRSRPRTLYGRTSHGSAR